MVTGSKGTVAGVVEEETAALEGRPRPARARAARGRPARGGGPEATGTGRCQERDLVWRRHGRSWALVLRRVFTNTGVATRLWEADLQATGSPGLVFVTPSGAAVSATSSTSSAGPGRSSLYRFLGEGFVVVPGPGELVAYVPGWTEQRPVEGAYDQTLIAYTSGVVAGGLPAVRARRRRPGPARRPLPGHLGRACLLRPRSLATTAISPASRAARGGPGGLDQQSTTGTLRVEDLEVGPIGADHSGMMTASRQHDRGVDHVGRPGLPAKYSCSPGPGVAQWLHKDVTSVEEPSQPCLAPAASPDLAYHSGRHNDAPVLLPRHLDDRRPSPGQPVRRLSGPRHQGPGSKLPASAKPFPGSGELLLGHRSACLVEQLCQDLSEVVTLEARCGRLR